MRVLIGCETSGIVREAFRAKGHEAWSCDLLPAQDGSEWHLQGDLFLAAISQYWDLLIFHPECTYLTNSAAWAFSDPDYRRYPGVGYHQRVKPGTLVGAERRAARELAAEFAVRGMELPIRRIAMENPIGALSTLYRVPDQIIHPSWYGEDASKATCLWFKNLPPLDIPPAHLHHPGRMVEWPRGSGRMRRRWSNQTDSGQNRVTPSDTRWQVRSNTYPGIARAMSEQWSTL